MILQRRLDSNWKTISIIDDNGVSNTFDLDRYGRLKNKFPKQNQRDLKILFDELNKPVERQPFVLPQINKSTDSSANLSPINTYPTNYISPPVYCQNVLPNNCFIPTINNYSNPINNYSNQYLSQYPMPTLMPNTFSQQQQVKSETQADNSNCCDHQNNESIDEEIQDFTGDFDFVFEEADFFECPFVNDPFVDELFI